MATNVVIQTAFLGDVLLGIPLLKRIRSLSDDTLALVVRKGVGEFFVKTGLVHQVFEIEKGNQESYDRVQKELRKMELHTVFLPHESLRSHFFVSGLRAEHKLGFKKWWNGPFFDARVRRDEELPDAVRQLSLLSLSDPGLEALVKKYKHDREAYKISGKGQLSAPPSWASMSVRARLLEDEDSWAGCREKLKLSDSSRRVLIFPGSVWATKKWTERGFIEVAESLQNKGWQVIWMGAPDEKGLCDRLAQQVPSSLVFAGQTSIYESALLLARSHLAIGNDSASMHLASAAETPLMSLFGPTVIEFGYRPWSEKAFIAQHDHLGCRPCGPHGHQKCPLGTHLCMRELSSAKVLKVIEGMTGGA